MGDRSTRYEVVETGGGERVLRAQSIRSASALWRPLSLQPVERSTLSWRWKVEQSLFGNDEETNQSGDDYAARVMILFGPEVFTAETEAICYVWAAEEPVGSVYWNPYLDKVATIVLESGDERSGQWIHEKRHVVEDFRKVFGRRPEMVSAVAVIVDTDDTGMSATAWFDDLRLRGLD